MSKQKEAKHITLLLPYESHRTLRVLYNREWFEVKAANDGGFYMLIGKTKKWQEGAILKGTVVATHDRLKFSKVRNILNPVSEKMGGKVATTTFHKAKGIVFVASYPNSPRTSGILRHFTQIKKY